MTLATATLVWQSGRRAGITASPAKFAPHIAAIPSPNTFNNPFENQTAERDFAQKFSAITSRRGTARTKDETHMEAQQLYELARAAHFQSRGGGFLSLAAYQEAQKQFRAVGDRHAEASVLVDMSDTQQLLGQTTDAENSLRAALSLREEGFGHPSQKADTLYRLGDFLQTQGRYAEARTTLDHALRLQQQLGNEPGIADCLAAMGHVAYADNSLALARQLLGDAARLFEKNGKVESRAAVLGQLGDVALKQGAAAEAENFYNEGLGVWEARKQGFWTGRFLVRLAQVALQEGDIAGAKRLAKRGRTLLATSNGPVGQARALVVLGQIAGREGKRQDALRYLSEAEIIYRATKNAQGLLECRSARTALSN